MGIPAGFKHPKSFLIIVVVYVLCSVIKAVTKALDRFMPSGGWGSSFPGNRPAKTGRTAWKTIPSIGFRGFSRKTRMDRGGEGVVCVVCLGDVAEGDEIRELRECLHAFHRECLDGVVDEGRRTCPICRTEFLARNVRWTSIRGW